MTAEQQQLGLVLTGGTLRPVAGTYTVPGLDSVRSDIRQTLIADAQDQVVQTIGQAGGQAGFGSPAPVVRRAWHFAGTAARAAR
ncbi:hypothetical protein ACVWZA_003802 [Sphingomonas sp. UYAg733]